MIVPEKVPDVEAVARHYDELDAFYREIWGEHVHHGLWLTGREPPEHAAVQLSEHAALLAEIQPGQRVCDAGSGYGATARLLVREFGAEVTAVTIAPRQYHYACSLDPASANPRYLLGNWLENEFEAATFDAVLALESTEHMPDKLRFFAEAARVLKPGGRLVVCAWLARERPKRWEIRHLLEPICREGRLPGMGTPSEYERFLGEAGFVITHFEDASRRVSRTWTICLLRMLWRTLLRPHYRRFLFDHRNENRVFAKTLLRIRLAYAMGAMRYGILAAQRT
jgi:cyclopropane fatty-acyl-phospholipid synthase-like methyltransferase